MKFDETTCEGMALAVIQLLKDRELLIPNTVFEDEMAEWVAPADVDKCDCIVAGDGLSHEHWRSYQTDSMDMQEQGVRFTKHFRQCKEILKALSRCLLLPGDLHLSLFHTLGPIYSVFYGGFLQPIQVALGFKRIDYKKV